MTKDRMDFYFTDPDIFGGGGTAVQAPDRLLKPAPEDEDFSEGFEPSAAFLERWRATAPKRRLADRLEKMRIDAGRTQAEIAEILDVDPTYVSKMESPVGPVPKADLVARFADACGYDTAYAFIRREPDAAGATAVRLHGLRPAGDAALVVDRNATVTVTDAGVDQTVARPVAESSE